MTLIPLSDRPTLIEAGLDFRRFGYFTRPLSEGDLCAVGPAAAAEWRLLENSIAALQAGDFSAGPALLAGLRASSDWRFKQVAILVLGHAGTVDCFREMRVELDGLPVREVQQVDVATRELFLLYCGAFAAWGRLDVVPVLMDCYLSLRVKATPEIAILPLLMQGLLTAERGSMIGEEPPEDRLEEYFSLVMSAHDDLVARLGSDKCHVHRGELLSVPALAQSMRHPQGRHVPSELRRLRERFEPATGIDCSGPFTAAAASPLEAAALAEDFLDSAAAASFEEGVRHFFGHRVPD